jgi:cytochrome c peroxidase
MHDGSMKTLREVVEFYNRGGGKNPNLDPHIKPLNLNEEELGYLIAFLEALSSDAPGLPLQAVDAAEDADESP